MKIKVSLEEGQGFLIIRAFGKWVLEDVKREMDNVRDEANRRGLTRLFLDMREMLPPDGEMTRYYTGIYIATVWCPPFKVVALAKPEMINKFGENVAVNRGANFAVFSDEKTALEWLQNG